MKAISIKQPFAWAIVAGHKDVENRTWSTEVRGRVLVHAGKAGHPDGAAKLRSVGVDEPAPGDLPRGAVVGSVEIVDCAFGHASPWAIADNYQFVLANPIRFDEPIPYKGQLGFFEIPADVLSTGPAAPKSPMPPAPGPARQRARHRPAATEGSSGRRGAGGGMHRTVDKLLTECTLGDGTPLHLSVRAAPKIEDFKSWRADFERWVDDNPVLCGARWDAACADAKPLVWNHDGGHYTPTRLVLTIMELFLGRPVGPSVRGPAWWRTEDGRSLQDLL